MTEPIEQGVSPALAAKARAFVSTLAPEEATLLQWAAQEILTQPRDKVQGYAASAARGEAGPASGRQVDQIRQEIPTPLMDKFREFAGTLSAEEHAQLQELGQMAAGDGDEVRGYTAIELLVVIAIIPILIGGRTNPQPPAHPFAGPSHLSTRL